MMARGASARGVCVWFAVANAIVAVVVGDVFWNPGERGARTDAGFEFAAEALRLGGANFSLSRVPSPLRLSDEILAVRRTAGGGSRLDLMRAEASWLRAMEGDLLDLRGILAPSLIESFDPRALEAGTVGGRLLALPSSVDAAALFYRSDLLERYGFGAPPGTWDELEQMAVVVQAGERNRSCPGGDCFWGLEWDGMGDEALADLVVSVVASHGGGSVVSPNGTVDVANSRAVAALERARGWVGNISRPGLLGGGAGGAREGFMLERGLFLIDRASLVGDVNLWRPYGFGVFQCAERAFGDRVSVASLPGSPPTGGGLAAPRFWGWAVSRHSPVLGEVRSVLEALSSESHQLAMARWGDAPALLSARASLNESVCQHVADPDACTLPVWEAPLANRSLGAIGGSYHDTGARLDGLAFVSELARGARSYLGGATASAEGLVAAWACRLGFLLSGSMGACPPCPAGSARRVEHPDEACEGAASACDSLSLGFLHDMDYSRVLLAAWMAVRAFNGGDGKVVAALGAGGGGAGGNISGLHVQSESQYEASASVRALSDWAANGVSAVVGPSWSLISELLSPVAALYELPLISHWATASTLSDERQYPFFSRTIPTHDNLMRAVPNILSALGWRAFVILHRDDILGTSQAGTIQQAAALHGGLDVVAFAFVPGDRASMESAVKAVKGTGNRVIVTALSDPDLALFVEYAGAEGIVGTAGYALVDVNAIHSTGGSENVAQLMPEGIRESVRRALPGTLVLGYTTRQNRTDATDAFQQQWAQLSLDQIKSDPMIGRYFGSMTQEELRAPCGVMACRYAYDAVFAGAMGWTQARAKVGPERCPTGTEVLEEIRALSFEGASGRVTFSENGDRGDAGVIILVKNVQVAAGGGLQDVEVGTFVAESGVNFYDSVAPVWPGGVTGGWEAVPPDGYCPEGSLFDGEAAACYALCPFKVGLVHDMTWPQEGLGAWFAYKMINKGDFSIVPAATQGVRYNVSQFVLHDEDPTAITQAVKTVTDWASEGVAFAAGPSWSLVSGTLSPVAALYEFPLISHWATASTLSDERQYPFFSRTIPTHDNLMRAVPNILSALGWRAFVILHRDDILGTSQAVTIQQAAALHGGLDVVAFAFVPGDRASMESAVKAVKGTGNRVIVLAVSDPDFALFVEYAGAEGIVGTAGYALVDVNAIHNTGGSEIIAQLMPDGIRESVRRALPGTLVLAYTTLTNAAGDAFEQQWAKMNTEELRADPVVGGLLGTNTDDQLLAPPGMPIRYAYDAVFAGAMGWTQARAKVGPERCPTGTEVLEEIRALSFEGASGRVTFSENGDRGDAGVIILVKNVQVAAGGGLQDVEVGTFVAESGVNFYDSVAPVWPGGVTGGWEAVPPDGYCPEGSLFDGEAAACRAECPFLLGLVLDVRLSKAVGAAFAMALRDVNRQDGSLVPAALGGGVTRELTLKVYDSSSSGGPDLPGVIEAVDGWASGGVVGILGPAWSSLAGSVSLLAGSRQLPVLSHWASSASLSNDAIYSFFGRVIPTDGVLSIATASFLAEMGWKSFVVLYRNDAWGADLADGLVQDTRARGITSLSFGFAAGNGEEVRAAVLAAKASGIRVVIFVGGDDTETLEFLDFGTAQGLIGVAGYTLIDMNYIGFVQPEQIVAALPADRRDSVRAAIDGTFIAAKTTLRSGNSSQVGDFDRRYAELALSEVNTGELGEVLNMTEAELRQPCNDVCRFAYDAVYAYALAWSSMVSKETQRCPKGSELLAEIRKLQFSGASGLVNFGTNGDRGDEGVTVVFSNIQRSQRRADEFQVLEMGTFRAAGGTELLRDSMTLVWPGGWSGGWGGVPPDGSCPEGEYFDVETLTCFPVCAPEVIMVHYAAPELGMMVAATLAAMREVESQLVPPLTAQTFFPVGNISLSVVGSSCRAADAVAVVAQSMANHDVAAFLGPYCNYEVMAAAAMAKGEVPFITSAANGHLLRTPAEPLPSVIRTVPSARTLALAIEHLSAEFGWGNLAVLHSQGPENTLFLSALEDVAALYGTGVAFESYSFAGSPGIALSAASSESANAALRAIRAAGHRVVLFIGTSRELATALELASGLGMTGPGHVWLMDRSLVRGGPELMALGAPPSRGGLAGALLYGFRQNDEPTPALARGLDGVSAGAVNALLATAGDGLQVTDEDLRGPCDTDCRMAFDAMWAFGHAWTRLLAADRSRCPSASQLLDEIRAESFSGASGNVSFTPEGDRLGSGWVISWGSVHRSASGALEERQVATFTEAGGLLTDTARPPMWPSGEVSWAAPHSDGLCPRGQVYDDGTGGCIKCPAGQEMRSLVCEPCAVGKVSVAPGTDCLPCAEGVADAEGMSKCKGCPALSRRHPGSPGMSLDECRCLPGSFLVREGECRPCPEGAQCDGDLAHPRSMPGYWMDTDCRELGGQRDCGEDWASVWDCRLGMVPFSACVGNSTCTEGREGALCANCVETHARLGSACMDCTDEGLLAFWMAFAVLVLVLCVYTLVGRTVFPWPMQAALSWWKEWQKGKGKGKGQKKGGGGTTGSVREMLPFRIMKGYLKTVVSFLQICSNFQRTFVIDWMAPFGIVAGIGDALKLDILSLIPSVACIEKNYPSRLPYFFGLFPALLVLLFSAPFLWVCSAGWLHQGGVRNHPLYHKTQQELLQATLIYFFLVYPAGSDWALSAFHCVGLSTRGNLLVSLISEDCPYETFGATFWSGVFFALVWVVLIPVGFVLVCRAYKVQDLVRLKREHAIITEMVRTFREETSGSKCRLAAKVIQAQPSSSVAAAAADATVHLPTLFALHRTSTLCASRDLVDTGAVPAAVKAFEGSEQDARELSAMCDRLGVPTNVSLAQLTAQLRQLQLLLSGMEQKEDLAQLQVLALATYDWRGRGRHHRRTLASKIERMPLNEQREALIGLALEIYAEGRLRTPALRWDGELVDEDKGLNEKEMLRSIGFLFDEYAADKWYFFLIMQFVKLLLVSVVGLIPGLPWVKLSWGFFFTVCISVTFLIMRPILDHGLNHFQTFAFVVMGSKLYYGLQLTRDGQEGKDYLKFAGMMIVALDILVIAYLPLLILLAQYRAKWRAKTRGVGGGIMGRSLSFGTEDGASVVSGASALSYSSDTPALRSTLPPKPLAPDAAVLPVDGWDAWTKSGGGDVKGGMEAEGEFHTVAYV